MAPIRRREPPPDAGMDKKVHGPRERSPIRSTTPPPEDRFPFLVLESAFAFTPFPDDFMREDLIQITGLSGAQIEDWLRNRRARLLREGMPTNVCSPTSENASLPERVSAAKKSVFHPSGRRPQNRPDPLECRKRKRPENEDKRKKKKHTDNVPVDVDGDMERPPRGPRNRPPYKSRMDRRRPSRGRQSRRRAGTPRGKRDDGDAPNKSDATDDYESKSDEPGETHENNSYDVTVLPSSNYLSSGSGEPSDSAQTNEGYSNENSPEQEQQGTPAKRARTQDSSPIAVMDAESLRPQAERKSPNRKEAAKGPRKKKCASEIMAELKQNNPEKQDKINWLESLHQLYQQPGQAGPSQVVLSDGPLSRRRTPAIPLTPSSASSSSGGIVGEPSPRQPPTPRQSPTCRSHHALRQEEEESPSPHLPPSPVFRRRRYPAIPLSPSSASSSSGGIVDEPSPRQPPTPRQSPTPQTWRSHHALQRYDLRTEKLQRKNYNIDAYYEGLDVDWDD